ncbi:MAG: hypothetical protein ACREGR_04685 [Minisyncoccia bacterium]
MRERTVGIPLAFALALSASASDVKAIQSQDQNELLSPGSLRRFLDTTDAAATDAAQSGNLPRSGNRISQWYNGGWFSCFYGNWRRC